MGHRISKQIQAEDVKQRGNFIKPLTLPEQTEEFQLSNIDIISEKTGKITNDYIILNPPLGHGSYGQVRKAIHKLTNQLRAIKIISKKQASQAEIDRYRNEVNILKNLFKDHPNIVKIFEFYQDSRYFYIVTELCTGGELEDKIIDEKSFSERKASQTLRQILSAINCCHEKNTVHRDLKPSNILYEQDHAGSLVRIADFGSSTYIETGKKLNQKVGTPFYIAPEVLNLDYDEKCDIWSVGVILYIMLCGSPPFNGKSDTEILNAVQRSEIKFEEEEWSEISFLAKKLVRKLLQKDPTKRISAKDALVDPWIQLYNKKQEVDLNALKYSLINMRNFKNLKKFQEASLMFMINFLATKEEKDELLKQFQYLDISGDGRLCREELVTGYKQVVDEKTAEQDVDHILQVVDKNNSGVIDYSEFVIATINRQALMENERLKMAFRLFDKDGSGSITIDEIQAVFGHNALVADQVWNDMVREVDENSDGSISFDEFQQMMLKISVA